MSDEQVLSVRIVSILLDEGGTTWNTSLVSQYKETFDTNIDEDTLKGTIWQLTKSGVLSEIDPDGDVFFFGSVDHSKHGFLNNEDLLFDTGFEILALGSKSLPFIHDKKAEISDACRFGKLNKAITHLQNISYEASTWTGLPRSFEMNDARKEDLKVILKDVLDRLRTSPSANSSETIQAKALIEGAIKLADVQNPQSDLIWANIQRASAIGGIIQLLGAAINFFTGKPNA